MLKGLLWIHNIEAICKTGNEYLVPTLLILIVADLPDGNHDNNTDKNTKNENDEPKKEILSYLETRKLRWTISAREVCNKINNLRV